MYHAEILIKVVLEGVTCQGQPAPRLDQPHGAVDPRLWVFDVVRLISHHNGRALQQLLSNGRRLRLKRLYSSNSTSAVSLSPLVLTCG